MSATMSTLSLAPLLSTPAAALYPTPDKIHLIPLCLCKKYYWSDAIQDRCIADYRERAHRYLLPEPRIRSEAAASTALVEPNATSHSSGLLLNAETRYLTNSGPSISPMSPIILLKPMPRVTCECTPRAGRHLRRFLQFPFSLPSLLSAPRPMQSTAQKSRN